MSFDAKRAMSDKVLQKDFTEISSLAVSEEMRRLRFAEGDLPSARRFAYVGPYHPGAISPAH
jgi:hypothetical protein